MAAYTKKFGITAAGKGGVGTIDINLDSTADNASAGWGAGDTISILLPAGTQILNALVKTEATWTGTISLGTTDSLTNIISGGTPAAAGSAITAQALLNTTTASIAALDAVTYLIVTIGSANTTGKLRISVLVHAVDFGNVG